MYVLYVFQNKQGYSDEEMWCELLQLQFRVNYVTKCIHESFQNFQGVRYDWWYKTIVQQISETCEVFGIGCRKLHKYHG